MEFMEKSFKYKFKISGDVLCLAGDICACGIREDLTKFIKFLEYICPKYQYVIHVSGNHEYYTLGSNITKELTMQGIDITLGNISKKISNYVYLNCDSKTLPINNKMYTFVGATLWAKVDPKDYVKVEERMNDYRYIYSLKQNKPYKFTIHDMQKLHKKHAKFITDACHAAKYPVILLTHHKPTADTLEKDRDVLTQAYEVDMTKKLANTKIKLAIHGHTHEHYDKIINGIRYVSNPRGYSHQRTGFVKDLVIKIS